MDNQTELNDQILNFMIDKLEEEIISTDVKQILDELIDEICLNEEKQEKQRQDLKLLREIDEFYINLIHEDDEENSPNIDPAISSPKCDCCESASSLFWRRVALNKIVCNVCFFNKLYLIVFDDAHTNKKNKNLSDLMDILNEELSTTATAGKSSNSKKKHMSKAKQRFMLNDKKFMAKVNANRKPKDTSQPVSARIEVKPTIFEEESSSSDSNNLANVPKEDSSDTRIRKSSRIPKNKVNAEEDLVQSSQEPKKEVNRRTKKFKLETKVPSKSNTLVSKVTNNDHVFHKGLYLKIGDIVALYDIDDKETIYFGQIRGFLNDQYASKSVVLTWLIPIDPLYKKIRYAKDFDASLFMLGPPEEFPLSLDYVEFVCRLERTNLSNGYLNKDNQYETDMLMHKFQLQDLAKSDVKYVSEVKCATVDDGVK